MTSAPDPQSQVDPEVADVDRLYPRPDLPSGSYTLVVAGEPVPAELRFCDWIERS